MIVTLASLRTRWVTLIGSFVALTLGVALLATMGLALASTLDAPAQRPERLAGAPVVVRGPDELRVGDKHRPLANYRGVPAGVAARLAAAVPTVADRSFAVRDGFTGHPWSVARFGGYRLTAGRAPAAPGEVVVSGDPAVLGSVMQDRRVVGTVEPAGYERAVSSPTRRPRACPRGSTTSSWTPIPARSGR
ncbi:hypothetical protein AB0C29_29850 [Actinoplanes sp. NPDC048791]|uniref:hypothetical protein n=1 Tax=Actinoplanes sp. NPDC048791 TaxID=3154623 RepID=UPI0033EB4A3D